MGEIQALIGRMNSLKRVSAYSWFYLGDEDKEFQKYIDDYCKAEIEKADKRLNELLK